MLRPRRAVYHFTFFSIGVRGFVLCVGWDFIPQHQCSCPQRCPFRSLNDLTENLFSQCWVPAVHLTLALVLGNGGAGPSAGSAAAAQLPCPLPAPSAPHTALLSASCGFGIFLLKSTDHFCRLFKNCCCYKNMCNSTYDSCVNVTFKISETCLIYFCKFNIKLNQSNNTSEYGLPAVNGNKSAQGMS